MSFLEAVETIVGYTAITTPVYEKTETKAPDQPLLLPKKNANSNMVSLYLFERGIDYEIINYCLANDLIYESLPYHNAVFVGYDEKNEPKYAAFRATTHRKILGDCTGSKKEYSFRLTNDNSGEVHLFECAIDLLSFATLCKIEGKDWKKFNLVSLSGVYSPAKKIEESKVPIALEKYLSLNPNINRIILHFDNDIAGRKATETLKVILPERYKVVSDPPPQGKDFNDFLCLRMGITPKRERSYER